MAFNCDRDINNLIEIIQKAKEYQQSKPIPEYVPNVNKPEPMVIEPEPEPEPQQFKSSSMHPLPERINTNTKEDYMDEEEEEKKDEEDYMDEENINNTKDEDEETEDEQDNNDNNNKNIDDAIMNEEEEERAMDGIVNHDLGSTFAGESFKRLRNSENKNDAAYYYYTNQLINKIHAPIVSKGIKTLMDGETNMIDHTILTKWIIEFLSSPITDHSHASKCISDVIEGILLSKVLIQPQILRQYKAKAICITKFTKKESINAVTDGLYAIFIFIYLLNLMLEMKYLEGKTDDDDEELIPYCIKGGKYMRQPPLSLIHSTSNATYSPSEEWRWSIEIPLSLIHI